MVNIIKWREIPNGKINKENLEATLDRILLISGEEIYQFTRMYKGEISINEDNLILFSLEPAFVNNSKAEEAYLKLLNMIYDLFKATSQGKYDESAQATLNYIYTDFLLSNKIFEDIEETASSYEKLLLLLDISSLFALSAKYDTVSKVYDENGESVDLFSDEFLWKYFDTFDLLYSQLTDEIISSKSNSKVLKP